MYSKYLGETKNKRMPSLLCDTTSPLFFLQTKQYLHEFKTKFYKNIKFDLYKKLNKQSCLLIIPFTYF